MKSFYKSAFAMIAAASVTIIAINQIVVMPDAFAPAGSAVAYGQLA